MFIAIKKLLRPRFSSSTHGHYPPLPSPLFAIALFVLLFVVALLPLQGVGTRSSSVLRTDEAGADLLEKKKGPSARQQIVLWEGSHPFVQRATHDQGELSLLSWNICFLPWNLPSYFGGVASAQERLEQVVQFIRESDADLVCLQEVHDLEATKGLYEALKEDYYHFFTDSGSSWTVALNSGLFVASRYPLELVDFTHFDYKGMAWGINKGYLTFLVYDGVEADRQPLALVTTTHLHPGQGEEREEVRRQELEEIFQQIAHQLESNRWPLIAAFLCGDLNVNRGSTEWELSPLAREPWIDSYAGATEAIDSGNCTATSYLEAWQEKPRLLKQVEKDPTILDLYCQESIDYILLLALERPMLQEEIATWRLPAFAWRYPKEALSDHHALLSRLRWQRSATSR